MNGCGYTTPIEPTRPPLDIQKTKPHNRFPVANALAEWNDIRIRKVVSALPFSPTCGKPSSLVAVG
jgi:hypothetical protein